MTSIRKIVVFLLLLPIRFYQLALSPLLRPSCRHVPTCSVYVVEAIKIHGPFKGFLLGFKRVLRCNPWGTHGYDPVPPKKSKKYTTA